jgi:hypothetical protein
MRFATFLSALALGLGGAADLAQATVPPKPEVQLKMPSRGTYTGTVVDGVSEGLFSNGDRYQGAWKNGKPDGVGTMTYMLGGSYEGECKNGRREGKGVMPCAGSARRADVRFANDRRVDVAAPPPPVATDSAKFWLVSLDSPTGSHIANKVAYGPLPLDQGFDDLTTDQQRFIRSYYPALDDGDDPPYPLKGGKELYVLLVSLIRYVMPKDDIQVYVALDADANVTSVTTISPLSPKIKELISTAAGLLKYKPAQCGGRPCAGVVPFNLNLHFNL